MGDGFVWSFSTSGSSVTEISWGAIKVNF